MPTISFYITDPYGVPKLGVTGPDLQFLKYVTRTGGTIGTHPTLVEVGGGAYKFEVSSSDALLGAVFLIQTSNTPPYFAGTVNLPDDPFEAFALVNESSGLPWSGPDPVFGLYSDFAGTPRTAPSILALGSGLYTFTPPIVNMVDGDMWRIDSPIGAFPPLLYGSSGPHVTAAPEPKIVSVPHIITPTFQEPVIKPLSRKGLMDSGEV